MLIFFKRLLAAAMLFAGSLSCYSQQLPKVNQPVFKKDTFSIAQFGAKKDGITLNTKSITEAIDGCNAKGGGVVLVPAGLWVTGPLQLKSNVNLCIAKGALLLFTPDFDQYQLVEGSYEGLPAFRNQAPISANNADNIAITGSGILDGNGSVWRIVNHDRQSELEWKKLIASGGIVSIDEKLWYPSEKSMKGSTTPKAGVIVEGKNAKDYEDIKDFLRPNMIVFTNCKKVLLEGVTFQNSPAWCLHLLMCDQLTVNNVVVKNPWFAQNGDGIDVESCTNVHINGSTFDVGDDGICLKSGRDEAGRRRGKPTMNVIVENCIVYHAHGGFVIGSEMSGGVKNIVVRNCTFMGTDIGLRFKTTRGRGGVVENIDIANISMKDIVNEAILFDMYYFAKSPSEGPESLKNADSFPVTDATPQFKNFTIDNLVCAGASKAVFIRGLPEMNITGVSLSNMVIRANEGIECIEANNIDFKNVKLVTSTSSPLIKISNGKDIKFEKIAYNDTNVLVQLNGHKCKNISLVNTNTSMAKTPVEYGVGLGKDVFIQN